MTTLWKLTTQGRRTHNGLRWEPGVWQPPLPGAGPLCSGDWYHAYQCEDPWLALLMNPVHANVYAPLLWRAEGRGRYRDDSGLKCGFSEMRIVGQPVRVAPPSHARRVAFALFCAGQVFTDERWQEWAARWVDGTDRSATAGLAAARWAGAGRAARAGAAGAAETAGWAARASKDVLANAIAWARAVAP